MCVKIDFTGDSVQMSSRSFHKVFIMLLLPITSMRSPEGKRQVNVIYPGFLTNTFFCFLIAQRRKLFSILHARVPITLVHSK